MFREVIGEDEGMVFIFREPSVHLFWMKNVLVPLDMIWLDDTFKVIHIESSAPPCKDDPCPSYGPMRKASYVVEFQGGMAEREGIMVGAPLPVAFP